MANGVWRVATWNILGSHRPDLLSVAAEITRLAADVVALQEVQRGQARALARTLGWQHIWTRKHYPYSPLVWWRAEGIAILSPSPLTDRRATNLSPGVSISIHRHRVLLAATVRRTTQSLRVYCTHLAADDADARIAQARRVSQQIRGEAASLAVVAGDLNTTGDAVPVLREFRAVGLVDHGGDFSNPSIAPMQRIDHVLIPAASTHIRTDTPDGDARWHALSDHLPVVVEFDASSLL